MNGRVYDYNVGRFMSVDPVIQMPTNSQSINPYSYIMNNPLAGTDPTGYEAVCDDKKCHEQERKVEEPTEGRQTNNGADNYQGTNSSSFSGPGYNLESNSNSKQEDPNVPEDRVTVTCNQQCQDDARSGGSIGFIELGLIFRAIYPTLPANSKLGFKTAQFGWGALIIVTAGIPGSTPQSSLNNMRDSSDTESEDSEGTQEEVDEFVEELEKLSTPQSDNPKIRILKPGIKVDDLMENAPGVMGQNGRKQTQEGGNIGTHESSSTFNSGGRAKTITVTRPKNGGTGRGSRKFREF